MTTAFAAVKVSSKDTNKQATTNTKVNRKTVVCYYCNKKGHFKSECCKRQLNKGKENNNNERHQALSAELRNIQDLSGDAVWLADSAASKHMTSRREWFKEFKERSKSQVPVQIGDNSHVYAEGIGSVEVEAYVNGQWEPRTIKDCLFVPNLKKNLFSIGAVTSRKLEVTFDIDKLSIKRGRSLVAT